MNDAGFARPDPGQRSPELRKQSLLDSAIVEFSTHGLGGARVDRIAERAQSNKAMLYHYFGNKDDLYLAAIEELYNRIRNAEDALQLDPKDPVAAITALIAFTFRYYIENPAFIRMINTENLHNATHLQTVADITARNNSILDKVAAILAQGVEQGIFRPVDPLDLYISISALSFTYVSNRHTLQVVFARDLLADTAVAQRLATMTDMILRYLASDHG